MRASGRRHECALICNVEEYQFSPHYRSVVFGVFKGDKMTQREAALEVDEYSEKDRILALVGPWLKNKGDELMFRSVLAHFGAARIGAPAHLWPTGVPAELVPMLEPPTWADFANRSRWRNPIGLLRLAAKGAVLSLKPSHSIALSGRVHTDRATSLLDCSGFGYGDAWTTRRMTKRYEYYSRLKVGGAQIVMLPQALGPFEDREMRDAAKMLFSTCALIFARDADSYQHLKQLGLDDDVLLRQAPDISHLLPGKPPKDPKVWSRCVCIVPNARMLDRTETARASAYLDFLIDAVETAHALDFKPVLVLHETNDQAIIDTINHRFRNALRVIDEDAETTKGIFSCCHAVVASRYHALVSCLSQGLPCIGTSWTHKYDRLFEEYQHERFLVSPEGDRDQRRERLREVLGELGHTAAAARLTSLAIIQKEKVNSMWREVDEMLL